MREMGLTAPNGVSEMYAWSQSAKCGAMRACAAEKCSGDELLVDPHVHPCPRGHHANKEGQKWSAMEGSEVESVANLPTDAILIERQHGKIRHGC